MITSLTNPKVKLARALQQQRRAREAEGRFVAEGVRLLETALQSGAPCDFLLYTPEAEHDPRSAALLTTARARQVTTLAVSAAVLRACSDTESPQGVLGVLPIVTPAAPDPETTLLIADGIRDPGNLGTLLRTAAAAAVRAVVLAPGSVDAYNPKVVRGAMGAHFSLNVRALEWGVLALELAGRPVWLADARGGRAPWQADLRAPLALVIGGEAEGASPAAQRLATGKLTLPLAPGVESLNAATAAAVVLFEMVRQRS